MKERRVIFKSEVRATTSQDGQHSISGYAAVFNSLSEYIAPRTREVIAPGAFSEALSDDVRALFNHEDSMILGRTSAGTLQLAQDNTGLYYSVTLPDTQYARDLLALVKRGDVTQNSFAFSVRPEDVQTSEAENGDTIETITRVKRLYDVSPVTYPAYPAAAITAYRNFQDPESGARNGGEEGAAAESGTRNAAIALALAALDLAEHQIY